MPTTKSTTKTQGTHLFAIMPDDSVVRLVCVTGLNYSGGDRADKASVCLDSDDAVIEPGELDAGNLNPTINFDPDDAGHAALWNLHQKKEGTMLRFYAGMSGSTSAPTVVDDEVVLPPDRRWLPFLGFLKTYPWNAEAKSDYQSAIQIRLSGLSPLIPATVQPGE